MILDFLRDRGGNYAMLMGFAMLPIMGSVAIAIDFSEMNRQKQATINALDAAGVATARQVVSGASNEALIAYANEFFKANLGTVDPDDTELTVVLPNNQFGGGTLKLSAVLNYEPYFLPSFLGLLGKPEDERDREISFAADSEIRLKNTLEVALVLDNSTSMNEYGPDSGQKRMALLKTAAKQLVDTLALQAAQIKQVAKPVQFSLVPFAASVNVAPSSDDKPWMDTTGISPIHHENFDWSQMTEDKPNLLGDRFAEKVGNVWYKRGTGWGLGEDQPLTRFSLYADMIAETGREEIPGSRQCVRRWSNGTCREYSYDYTYTTSEFASWQGCVEARPFPYNNNDETPTPSNPATLFVPMFAPDEAKHLWRLDIDGDGDIDDNSSDLNGTNFGYGNNWWADWENTDATSRQADMRKYFRVKPYGSNNPGSGDGPNFSCTTTPITPLTDVTTEAGLATIKTAIDTMAANGYTNVPEGTAWGWRTISSTAPFTEGRPETEKGNDKVIIVLTDGANTYSAQGSDPAGNKSTYAAYGYTGQGYDGTGTTRMFMGTSGAIGKYDYSGSNYTNSLNEHMTKLCDNAKAANVLMLTVSLDLSDSDAAEKAAMEALKKCASDSRFRKDPTDASKPAKLYFNATSSNLAEKFKEIADELSNLRIVG